MRIPVVYSKLAKLLPLFIIIFLILGCDKTQYEKGLLLFNKGEYTESLKEIATDTTARSFYLKTKIYIITGKYEWVEDTLRKLIKEETLKTYEKDSIINLFDMLTQKLWDDGMGSRAIKNWAYLLKYVPTLNIGRGFYPLAMESLKVIKEEFPSYEASLSTKEKERVERTLFYLMNALSMTKNRIVRMDLYNGIVDLLIRLHDYNRALVWINKGMADIGDNSGLRVKKGIMLFQLIEKSLMKENESKALEYTSLFIANGTPQNLLDDVYYIRGELFYKKGLLKQAQSAYQQVVKMHLYDSDFLKTKAQQRLKEIRSKKWEN